AGAPALSASSRRASDGQSGGRSDDRSDEPSDAEVERFYEEIRARIEPGDLINSNLEDAVARAIGIHSDSAHAVLEQLAAQNRIAIFSNGTFIHTDLEARAERPDANAEVAAADAQAFQALSLINSTLPTDRIRAIYEFDKATRAYTKAERMSGRRPAARSQVNALKQNATLDVLGYHLQAYDKALAERDQNDATIAHNRNLVRQALAWVGRSYFSNTHYPEMLDADSHAWLMRLVNSLNPDKHLQKPDGHAIASGIRLMQEWAEGLGPESKDEPQPAAAKNPSKALAVIPGGKAKGDQPQKAKDAGNLDDLEGFETKLRSIGMPAKVQEVAIKEFKKYKELGAKDSEGQKLRSYLEWLTEVPWSQRTDDVQDLNKARQALDKDHFGMERVKERVLEFLALRKRTGSKKGAILLFTGPPGVGKTSIAGAIAEALGRTFVRLSLGGVQDEAVLRGHGRTYLGSLPGQIIRRM
ncbi:MAG: AAA family ATPase, partial [candidate division NC10 bacterium]